MNKETYTLILQTVYKIDDLYVQANDETVVTKPEFNEIEKIITKLVEEERKKVIAEISKAIYAMEWSDPTQFDANYWTNVIAWNVGQMGKEQDLPQGSGE